ncbi:hypothetical protein CPAR01_05040, partial [Colletotrichum paranaense]
TASTHLPYFGHNNWNSQRVPFRSDLQQSRNHPSARSSGRCGAFRRCEVRLYIDNSALRHTIQATRANKPQAEGSSHKKAHDKNERNCLGLVNNRLIFAQPHQSRQGTGGEWMGWARMQKVAASRKKKQEQKRADHFRGRYG